MVYGSSSDQTVSRLFQNNQSDIRDGRYQKISGPNDVADKTTALALSTAKTLDNGLINALDHSVENLNKNIQTNQANGSSANVGARYDGNGRLAINAHKTGSILSKII